MQFKQRHGWAALFILVAVFSAVSTRVVATDEIVPFSGSGGGGGVSAVTGTTPVVSSGGTTPAISMHVADAADSGYLASTDWATFNGSAPATRTISTTAPITGGGDLSANRVIAIPAATTSVNGYLTSTDWTTFNGKVTSVSGTAPVVSSGGATPAISMHVADVADNGYLSSIDWAAFNGKQAAISATAPVTFSANTVAITQAGNAGNGYLSSTDWATFNGKAASGVNADITALSHAAKLYPATNSVAALQVTKADGTTVVANFDTTNARVGIGSASPSYQLTVDGGSLDAASGNGVLNLVSNPTNFGPEVRLNNLASGHTWLLVGGASGDAAGNGNFGLQDGGTLRFMIDTSGDVGIGSASPASKLDVNGGVRLFTATSRPTCTAGIRGTTWVTSSGAGVTDVFAVCLKAAADTYSWVQVVTGG